MFYRNTREENGRVQEVSKIRYPERLVLRHELCGCYAVEIGLCERHQNSQDTRSVPYLHGLAQNQTKVKRREVMENLKIRVATEAESKEAQELFFELGYYWAYKNLGKKLLLSKKDIYLFAESDGTLGTGTHQDEVFFKNWREKEITLQELRDMINPMKEYLEKQADGSYKLVMRGIVGKDDDIEVPEGSEVAYKGHDSGAVYFTSLEMGYRDAEVIWKRHTQPEELPFMDSLNDQYAEIEQVRQNVFKATDFGVSGLPEFKHDFVNHPKHYCDHPSGIECIEITRHHDFAIGNAIKYLWRAGLKDSDNEIQDLKKAVWYIQDKIAQLENK